MTRLSNAVLAIVLLVQLGLLAWQHQTVRFLQTEENDLREQLAQATLLRDENERLTQQIKKAVEDSRADQQELVRLRGESSRLHQLEQENAQLKVERARMSAEVKQAQSIAASTLAPQPVPPIQAPTNTSPADVKYLGVVEFSDGVPQQLSLADGKECTVTATALMGGNLQLAFTSSSEINGVPIQSERTMTLESGKQLAVVIDGVEITLTPSLKAK